MELEGRRRYTMDYKNDEDADIKACRRCCCITLVAVLTAVLVVLLVVLVILKPKRPDFTLQDVRIVEFRLDQPPTQTTSGLEVLLTLNLQLTVAAENPNKLGIRYSTMRIVVYYREFPIGLAMVPAFYQPAHSRTIVSATLLVDGVNVVQDEAFNLLQDASTGIVKLRVAGKVPAQVTILGVTTPRVQVGISCQIEVNPRQQQLLSKQCGVKNVNL